MSTTLTSRPAPVELGGRPDPAAIRRAERAREVLEHARSVIDRGWLQHGWYVVARPRPRPLLGWLRLPGPAPTVDELERACLVAAVAVAAHDGGRPDPLRSAGPALDAVWDVLRGADRVVGRPEFGRAAPAEVRTRRMRELVRWNDAPGRTREDVLNLLDRAIGHTILAAVGAGRTR